MAKQHHNPIGTDGFEFIEFTGPKPEVLVEDFKRMGFRQIGTHRHKDVRLLRQNDINLIVNAAGTANAGEFAAKRGQSTNALAFRVRDAAAAIKEVERRGAEVVENHVGPMELNIPCIRGVGGALVYLVDRYGSSSIYDVDFDLDEDAMRNCGGPLKRIDHLTHNLYFGNMKKFVQFYEDVFNFRELQYFDIRGEHTGLVSKVMISPCDRIQIPLNESDDPASQINEYLDRYQGEGIQHIAFATEGICGAVRQFSSNGVVFMDTPDTYYRDLPNRVQDHNEDVGRLRDHRVLLDGSVQAGFLLQIFTRDLIGPIFFELIERKGNKGFGEGNFTALFESIEKDQMERGVLNVEH